MQANISITSTNSEDKKQTTNITYVNPDATDQAINEFARGIMSLSDNTLDKIEKTTKTEISSGNLISPDFYIDESGHPTSKTIPIADIIRMTSDNDPDTATGSYDIALHVKDGKNQQPYIKKNDTNTPCAIFGTLYDNKYEYYIGLAAGTNYYDYEDVPQLIPTAGEIIVAVPATDTYFDAEIKLTITE